MNDTRSLFANMPIRVVKDEVFRDASPFVRKCAEKVVAAAAGKPILDVACGSGRNAIFLARLGGTVICIDKDLSSLDANLRHRKGVLTGSAKRLIPERIDLLKDPWPFGPGSVGGIINVHCLLTALLSAFAISLVPQAYLLLETVPGHGANYLELPQQGELRAVLEPAFDLASYEERPAGPSERGAVAVKLLARRKI
ncbi:MAG: class I SAM-dependent methyltransferase [Terracidiphilus sp.]